MSILDFKSLVNISSVELAKKQMVEFRKPDSSWIGQKIVVCDIEDFIIQYEKNYHCRLEL